MSRSGSKSSAWRLYHARVLASCLFACRLFSPRGTRGTVGDPEDGGTRQQHKSLSPSIHHFGVSEKKTQVADKRTNARLNVLPFRFLPKQNLTEFLRAYPYGDVGLISMTLFTTLLYHSGPFADYPLNHTFLPPHPMRRPPPLTPYVH